MPSLRLVARFLTEEGKLDIAFGTVSAFFAFLAIIQAALLARWAIRRAGRQGTDTDTVLPDLETGTPASALPANPPTYTAESHEMHPVITVSTVSYPTSLTAGL